MKKRSCFAFVIKRYSEKTHLSFYGLLKEINLKNLSSVRLLFQMKYKILGMPNLRQVVIIYQHLYD